MKLTGYANAIISTPHGMVQLSRDGEATLSVEQAAFIEERIAAGSLPGYSLEDDQADGELGDTEAEDKGAEKQESSEAGEKKSSLKPGKKSEEGSKEP